MSGPKTPRTFTKEISRTAIKKGRGGQLLRIVENVSEGVFTNQRIRFEIEGKETPALLKARRQAERETPGEGWEYYALKYPESRTRTVSFLEEIRDNCTIDKARAAAIVGLAQFRHATDEGRSTADRLEAAFQSGLNYQKAIATGADAITTRGRKMDPKRAAMVPRKRDPNREFWAHLKTVWEEYRSEAQEAATPSGFVEWLKKIAHEFEITPGPGTASWSGHYLKWETIRKKIKNF